MFRFHKHCQAREDNLNRQLQRQLEQTLYWKQRATRLFKKEFENVCKDQGIKLQELPLDRTCSCPCHIIGPIHSRLERNAHAEAQCPCKQPR